MFSGTQVKALTILVSCLVDTGCVLPVDSQGGCSDTHEVGGPGVEASDGVVLSGKRLNLLLIPTAVLSEVEHLLESAPSRCKGNIASPAECKLLINWHKKVI